ncbi:hypothetical protein ACFLRZ_02595 [Bacteroidota bacterium]
MLKSCSKCLLSEHITGVQIGVDSVCNYCSAYIPFSSIKKSKLLRQFEKAKKKGRIYDALVPLSGGKDSSYVLYLAVKKYKLKVLTYTFDNGFMSELSRTNINSAIKTCEVDHIWIKHDTRLLYELYRTALINSGEICGICGIGIERSMLKISATWRIPLILLGHSPTEQNSFTSENIYDQSRLKAILRENSNIDKDMISRFLIYPKLNYISSYLYTKLGRFGKKINILYYENLPSDKEIGVIIKHEMNWKDASKSEYTRHMDCLAEPFTNYIREKRFGFSRRLPQLSNMIRTNEITRKEAIEIYRNDNKNELPANYELIKNALNLKENDIAEIVKIPDNMNKYQLSIANIIFAAIRRLVKNNGH